MGPAQLRSGVAEKVLWRRRARIRPMVCCVPDYPGRAMTGALTASGSREPRPELGPAIRVLPRRWQNAVLAIFATRGDRTAALRLAGYKDSPGLKGFAHRVFSDDRVRAALAEECRRHIDATEPEVMAIVGEIMANPAEKASDRLRAAAMLWDRSRPVETKLKVYVEHHRTHDERDMLHYRALQRIGAPPEAFLARFGANGHPRIEAMAAAEEAKTKRIEGETIIDAEYEEVSTSPEVEFEKVFSFDGL